MKSTLATTVEPRGFAALRKRLYALGVTLRSGMWAVTFTDLAGSTAQRARIGDQAADELRREHDAIVAHAAATHDGHVVKSTGDGSMAVFAGAADAVEAAVAIQQGVELRNRGSAEPLGLRVGISLGDLAHENGDLFGLAVNEAARLCALADAGEILLSDLVRAVSALAARERVGRPRAARVERVSGAGARLGRGVGAGRRPGADRTSVGIGGRGERDVVRGPLVGARRAARGAGPIRVRQPPTRAALRRTRNRQDALAAEVGRRAHDDGCARVVRALRRRSRDSVSAVHRGRSTGTSRRPAPILLWAIRPPSWRGCRFGRRSESARRADAPASDAETAQYRLFDAIGSWLRALASQQPVVVILDDLHWASKPTLLMLKHLLENDLAIASPVHRRDLPDYRPRSATSAGPDARGSGTVRPACSASTFRASTSGASTQLVENAADRPLDDSTRELSRTLHSETRGNAFFVGEVLRHMLDTGAACCAPG